MSLNCFNVAFVVTDAPAHVIFLFLRWTIAACVCKPNQSKKKVALNFLMCGKDTMCGVPRKPGVPMTLERSRGILVSTPTSTTIGQVPSKRVALAVEKTSKPWQIGCRPGFGAELPSLVSMEFLAMCKEQQRPAAFSLSWNKLLAPTSLKPICWRFFPSGRRRISVNI